MSSTVKCIKFGHVLLDENLEEFILCISCRREYTDLKEFRTHLDNCELVEEVFRYDREVTFDPGKGKSLSAVYATGLKKYKLYDVDEINILEKSDSLIDLTEVAVMDPRWYDDKNVQKKTTQSTNNRTNLKKTNNANVKQRKELKYDELVEAVTPFVQFKENVTKNSTPVNKFDNVECVKSGLTIKRKSPVATITTNNKNTGVTIKRKLPIDRKVNDDVQEPEIKKLLVTYVIDKSSQSSSSSSSSSSKILKKKTTVDSSVVNEPKTAALIKEKIMKKIENKSTQAINKNSNNNNNIDKKSNLNAINVEKNHNIKYNEPTIKKIIISKAAQLTNAKINIERSTQPPSKKPITSTPPATTTVTKPTKQQQQQQKNVEQPSQPPQQQQQKTVEQASQPQQQQQITIKNVENGTKLPIIKSTNKMPSINSNKTNTETDQILNKLQTLGLQIKRTQPPLPKKLELSDNTSLETQNALQKLAKIGMKVERVSANDANKATKANDICDLFTTENTIIKRKSDNAKQNILPNCIRTTKASTNNNNNLCLKETRLNKNLIVKKL